MTSYQIYRLVAILSFQPLLTSFVHVTVHRNKCFYNKIKRTRCTNFPNSLPHESLHVSDSSSAHHQEFIHCTLDTGVCHTGLWTAFEQGQDGPARKLSTNMYDIYQCRVYSE